MNKSKVRHRISSQHIVETLRKSHISEYFHSLHPPSRVFPKTSTHYYVAIRRNVLLLSLKIFRRLSNLRSERYSDEFYYYLGREEIHVYVRRGRAGGRVGGTGAYRPARPAQLFFTAPCGCGLQHREPWGRIHTNTVQRSDSMDRTSSTSSTDPQKQYPICRQ